MQRVLIFKLRFFVLPVRTKNSVVRIMRIKIVCINLTTADKMLANGIFDLKHREYNQKEFSWIYLDSARKAVQNGNKILI